MLGINKLIKIRVIESYKSVIYQQVAVFSNHVNKSTIPTSKLSTLNLTLFDWNMFSLLSE